MTTFIDIRLPCLGAASCLGRLRLLIPRLHATIQAKWVDSDTKKNAKNESWLRERTGQWLKTVADESFVREYSISDIGSLAYLALHAPEEHRPQFCAALADFVAAFKGANP